MITGQELKFEMVISFLNLVQKIYDSSNLIMSEPITSNTLSGGQKKPKKYKIITNK